MCGWLLLVFWVRGTDILKEIITERVREWIKGRQHERHQSQWLCPCLMCVSSCRWSVALFLPVEKEFLPYWKYSYFQKKVFGTWMYLVWFIGKNTVANTNSCLSISIKNEEASEIHPTCNQTCWPAIVPQMLAEDRRHMGQIQRTFFNSHWTGNMNFLSTWVSDSPIRVCETAQMEFVSRILDLGNHSLFKRLPANLLNCCPEETHELYYPVRK